MAHGKLTRQVARVLQQEFNSKGFDILHDHGEKGIDPPNSLGKLRSWFGSSVKSETILADLDMAVVSHDLEKVYALIEIEETTDNPKVILGDVLAALLGNGIVFKRRRNLSVGKWTTLVVMAKDVHQSHSNRLAYLFEQTNHIRAKLLTPNASIGQIVIDTFSDDEQLIYRLRQHISNAINKPGTS